MSNQRKLVTLSRLHEALDYDANTGIFTWRVRRGGIPLGKVAGTTNHTGHVQIMLDGLFYGAHRLAWFYVHGEWTKEQ